MFRLRSPFKRVLAALLPACLGWMVAACVMLCTAHASEVRREQSVSPAGQTELSSSEDCCPVTTSLTSALPDRRSPIPKAGAGHAAPCGVLIEPLRRAPLASAQTLREACFPDPPRGPCRPLRI
jgi:hypothetical protein